VPLTTSSPLQGTASLLASIGNLRATARTTRTTRTTPAAAQLVANGVQGPGRCPTSELQLQKKGVHQVKKFLYHFLMNQNHDYGDILVMYIVYSRHHSLLEEFWEFINRQRMELRQPK
jgi:hypothetical protein